MFNFKKLFQSNLINKTILIRQQSLKTTPRAKRPWLTFVKGIVYVEVAFFIGTYLVWKRMNDSQEFRFYMKNNWPTILEGYYLNGEMLGNLNTRALDTESWNKQK